MPRLADMVKMYRWSPPFWCGNADDHWLSEWRSGVSRLLAQLRESTVIVADNVTEYLYGGTDQEEWQYARDFPCCAPPFESFFIETRRPSRIVSEDKGDVDPSILPAWWGWLFTATTAEQNAADIREDIGRLGVRQFLRHEIEQLRPLADLALVDDGQNRDVDLRYMRLLPLWDRLMAGDVPTEAAVVSACLGGAAWVLHAALIVAEPSRGIVNGPLISMPLFLDEQGRILGAPLVMVTGGELTTDKRRIQEVGEMLPGLIFFALLTLSFMHCKNVAVKEVTPPPKDKKQERALRDPWVRYRLLDIAPMQTVLRGEGRSEEVGLRRALHICRGHFASYAEDRPLFGRAGLHGRFWIPQHVRGSTSAGVVRKDYKVSPS